MERWSPPPCMVCSSFCPTKLFSLFPRPPHPRRVSGRLAPVLNFPARRRASFPPQFMGRTIGYLRDRTVTRRESTIFAMSDGASASPPHSKSASDTVVTTSDDQQQEDSNYDNSYLINTTAPRKNREETVKALDNLLTGQRPTPCDVFGSGPLLLSDIPSECLPENGGKPVVMGIDEAGRGPVLGPMIYGAAFWAKDVDASIIPKDFNDSKQLSAEKRDELFEKIKSIPNIGFVVRVLHASEISRSMLRKDPYNLNAMSHDAAMQMIRAVLDAGVKIDTCYVDTVGIAGAYQSKLEREFNGHGIRFVVEKKADANYAPCSAGSVVAKVSRDVMTAKWKYSEPNFEPIGGNDFGSGYPSDPKCKEWMEKNLGHPIFGYPDFARFSWAPMKKTMDEEGITMRWEADDDEEDDPQQMSLNAFVVPKKSNDGSKQPKRKRARLGYHEKLGLTAVTELVVS